MALVVRDHEHDARGVRSLDHGRGLGRGETHRLLDEDVDACLRGLDRHGRVAAAGQHEDGVDGLAQKVAPVGAGRLDSISRGARGGVLGRDVADCGDLESVGQLAEVVQVHHLGDEAGTDDADSHARGLGSRRRDGSLRERRRFDRMPSGDRRPPGHGSAVATVAWGWNAATRVGEEDGEARARH